MAEKLTYQDLLDAGVHFGHLTRKWFYNYYDPFDKKFNKYTPPLKKGHKGKFPVRKLQEGFIFYCKSLKNRLFTRC